MFGRIGRWIVIWGVGGMLIGLAVARQGFTLKQVLSSPFPSNLVAAPSGDRIAWVFNTQGVRNVWVAQGPAFQARPLTPYTEDDGQELSDLAFTPDGRGVVYVRGGSRNRVGEYPNPTHAPAGVRQQVWFVPWEGGPPRRLGEGHSPAVSPDGTQVAFVHDGQIWIASLTADPRPAPLFYARGENGDPVWSPDGRRLAFVSRRGTHSFIGIYDRVTNTVRYLAPSVDRDSHPRWSPDGRRIAFVRRPGRSQPLLFLAARDVPDPWAIMVVDLKTEEVQTVWRSREDLLGTFPWLAGSFVLQWAAGDRLVFASEEDGWLHLYAISSEGGRPTLLTPGTCEVETVGWTPDRRVLVYSSNCEDIDRRHLWRVSVSGGKPQPLTQGSGIEWSPVVTSSGRWVVFFRSDARWPAMPHVMSLRGGKFRMIARDVLPADFPADQLVEPEPVVFESSDGWKIRGQLFRPRDIRPGERRPAVIFLHGGPIRQMLLGWHNLEYYHRAYGFNQYLVQQGYIVLSVNFRSGIGYGQAFRLAPNRGPRGASEFQDVVAAAEYLRSRPDVDPERIGLWGGSYGGYLTALGLARRSDLFAAGVDLHGVHDWSTFFTRRVGQGILPNAEAVRLAQESSPLAAVDQWRSPVLVVHGDDDRNVPFSETVMLVEALRKRGVPVEILVFPDEVHDFLLHRHWLEVYARAAAFLDRYLRGP